MRLCTPGMLMAAQDLVLQKKKCSREEISKPYFRQLLPLHGLPGPSSTPSSRLLNGQAELPLHAPGTQLDRATSAKRAAAERASACSRAAHVPDDLRFPRLASRRFFQKPLCAAKVKRLDFSKASKAEGVIAFSMADRSPEYWHPLDRSSSTPERHQVAAAACDRHRARVLAGRGGGGGGRRVAQPGEDAVELIEAEWEELPVVVDMDEALAGNTVIHPRARRQHLLKRELDTAASRKHRSADVVVEDTFHFGRHTGVCLEGRAILADYKRAAALAHPCHATQAPHMMQDIFRATSTSRGEREG